MTRENPRPPFPPFDEQSAVQKVRMAEDAWNTRNPERVSLAYTPDSKWRNRSEFLSGRVEIEYQRGVLVNCRPVLDTRRIERNQDERQ